MHEQFVEPTKTHADLSVPEGANSVAVNRLEERIRAEVAGTADDWTRESVEAALDDGVAIDPDG